MSLTSSVLFKKAKMVCFWIKIIGRSTEHPTPLREVNKGDWERRGNHHNAHQRNARLLGEFGAGKE